MDPKYIAGLARDPGPEPFAFSAVVRAVDSAQLDATLKANHALDATVFETREPHFWAAIISTDELDTYYTRMAESTLRNFATDAQAGVSFQNSHRTGELPFGRSLAGRFDQGSGDAMSKVEADFYTVPGLNLNGVATVDLIDGMRAGLLKDVSVGFYGGQFRCSECGRDMLRDWDCEHYPGMSYKTLDDKGNVIGERVAVAWIENARLSEVSMVYDGACPSAAVIKVHSRLATGDLTMKSIEVLEQRYRMALPHPTRTAPPGKPAENSGGQRAMEGDNPNGTGTDAALQLQKDFGAISRRVAEFQTRLAAHGFDPSQHGDPLEWATRQLTDQAQSVKDGLAFREATIKEYLDASAAVIGDKFNREAYAATVRNAPIETIRAMADDMAATRDAKFPTGRSTLDGAEPIKIGETQASGRRRVRDREFAVD